MFIEITSTYLPSIRTHIRSIDMRSKTLFVLLLLIVPGFALADGHDAHDVSSASPCQRVDLAKFRSAIFAKAAEPKSLWRLVTKALCGFDNQEGSIAAVHRYLAPSIRYVEETFTSEGDIDRDIRDATPGEISGILVPAREPDYAELSILSRQSVRLQMNNEVCAVEMDASLRSKAWVVHEVRTQCE